MIQFLYEKTQGMHERERAPLKVFSRQVSERRPVELEHPGEGGRGKGEGGVSLGRLEFCTRFVVLYLIML